VEKALEKNPADRYQAMREMVVDLRRMARQSVTGPAALMPPPARTYKSYKWIAAATTLGLALVAGAVALFRPRPPARVEYTQLTNFADSVVSPALSLDGRMLTFIRSEEDFWGFGEVYVKLLPDGTPKQLTHDGQRKVGPAVFSPDGSRIAYTIAKDRDWDTWTVPVLGGEPSRLLTNAQGFSWIETGAGRPHVLFARWTFKGPQMELYTSTESRSESRRIYLPEDPYGMVHRAYRSPDGNWVLLVEMGMNGWLPCRLIPFDGSNPGKQAGPAQAQCTNAGWSLDGKWMYFSANIGKGFHIWRQRFPEGEPEQITSGVAEEEGIAVSPDGRSLLTSAGTRRTTLWVHESGSDREINTEGYPALPSFSADGKKLYYLKSPGGHFYVSGTGELWVANLATGHRERLLPDLRIAHYDVSADGKRIVFIRLDNAGGSKAWLAPLDGSESPHLLTSTEAVTAFFGVEGEVIFHGGDGETKFVYRIKEDGSGLRKVVPDPVLLLYSVSPGGKWMATWAQGKSVVIYPVDGGEPVLVCHCANRAPPEQPALVTWSKDGRFLYLHETGLRQTFAVPLRTGEAVPRLPPSGIPSPAMGLGSIPGMKMLPQERAFGGPNTETYAFVRVTTQRNIYRIPVYQD
jgi:Tol biopolymer transport system component